MASGAAVPVTTIGGYLGAGKTTLINAMLRAAGGRRIAVLVNEFGALPIDEDLIEAQDDSIISIAGGCICCSFGNDLIGALGDLAQLDPPPDHIVIEASGVAIPGSIAANISLLQHCAPGGVVVLADAETLRAMAADKYIGDTILRQLADADLVIVTKADLAGEGAVAEVTTWIEGVATQAQVISAAQGRVPVDVLLGPKDMQLPRGGGHHADALFESVVLSCDVSLDARALAEVLSGEALGLVRAKGFVRDLSGQAMEVQVVGRRWSVTPAPAAARMAMVCIGKAGQLPKETLHRLCSVQPVRATPA